MNSIQTFLASQIASLLADSLLHSLWQGIIISTLLLIALKCLTGSQARWRYCLSTAALFLVLISWLITFSVLQQQPGSKAGAPGTEELPTAVSSPPIQKQKTLPAEHLTTRTSATTIESPIIDKKEHLNWLIIGWMAGVGLMLMRMFTLLCGAARHRKAAVPLTDSRWLDTFRDLCNRMGIRQKIRIMVSTTLSSPGVIGAVKPMLLIPAAMVTALPPAHIEAILAHELAHIRRWDYLVNLAQMFIETLLFFNPAVWWISRQIRMEREACCDQESVQSIGCRIEYAKALATEFARTAADEMPFQEPLAVHLSGQQPTSTVDRIKRIICPRSKPGIKIGWMRLAALTLLTSLSIVVLSKAADVTVEAVAKIMTPKERVEKLQDIYANTHSSSDTPDSFSEMTGSITVSGRFELPEGDVPPEQISYTITSSGNRSSSYGAWAEDDLSFSSKVPSRSDIRIAAYVPGYAPFYSESFHPVEGRDLQDIHIELKHGFSSSIQVVNENGTPLPGIELKWLHAIEHKNGWSGLGNAIQKTTDTNGTVPIEDGSEYPVRISIAAKGFQPIENKQFTINRDQPLVITLKKGLTQEFTVVSQTTGRPVPGAKIIQCTKKNPRINMRYGNDGILLGTTDESGTLKLDTLEGDAVYGLSIKAAGYNPLIIEGFSVTNQTANISLADETVLRGTITGNLSRLQKTHIDGTFQFAVSYSGYGIQDGTRRWLRGGWVPVEIEDGVGHFELRGFIGDEMILRPKGTKKDVHLKIGPSSQKEISFTIDDDLPVWEQGSRIVEFTFITPEGLPKAAGNCTAGYRTKETKDSGYKGWTHMPFTVSNGIGRASFPAPVYIKLVGTQDLVGYWMEPEREDVAWERLIEPGETPFKLSYTLHNSSGGIFGKLLTADGNPTDGMFIDITPIIDYPPFSNKEPTPEEIRKRNEISEQADRIRRIVNNHGKQSKNGTFSYPSLPLNNTYKIIATSGFTLMTSEAITLTEKNPIQKITMQCNPTQSIWGELSKPDGAPCSNMQVEFKCDVMNGENICYGYGLGRCNTDANGGFAFDGINPHPDLKYYISVDPGDGWQPIQTEVTPGEQLSYTLEKGLPLTGRVIDHETGLPLTGVTVGISELSNHGMMPPSGYSSVTDSEGYFSFSTLSPEPHGIGIYTQTNRFNIISPENTNRYYLTITGGQEEYIELSVQATNFPSFLKK